MDNQAPTGTVVINNGAAATSSLNVVLTLSATDAQGAVTQMRFSNSGTSYSGAEGYAVSKAWMLSSASGTKTVYVQFKDGASNWSAATTDVIALDTTAPTISGLSVSAITNSTALITWTTNEPATSVVQYGTTTAYGQTAVDSILTTAHAVQLSGLAPVTTYNYRVRSTDGVGNERIGSNSTFKTIDSVAPTTPVNVTATATTPTQVNVTWAASTDNVGVTGYTVFRNGVQVATPTATSSLSTQVWHARRRCTFSGLGAGRCRQRVAAVDRSHGHDGGPRDDEYRDLGHHVDDRRRQLDDRHTGHEPRRVRDHAGVRLLHRQRSRARVDALADADWPDAEHAVPL